MATKKTTAKVEKVEAPVKSDNGKFARIVLDVPSATVERFKVLCNLLGDTQSGLVTKAMDSYVSDRK
jgi:hypothetical protein